MTAAAPSQILADIAVAARALRSSSWPGDMAEMMDRCAERIESWVKLECAIDERAREMYREVERIAANVDPAAPRSWESETDAERDQWRLWARYERSPR